MRIGNTLIFLILLLASIGVEAQTELLLPANTSYCLCGNVVNDIQYMPNRDLYFATTNGLSLYNRNTNNWFGFSLSEGVIDVNVNAVLKDRKGNLWTGTALGLSKIDPNGFVTVYSTKIDIKKTPSIHSYSSYSTNPDYKKEEWDTVTISSSDFEIQHEVYFFDCDVRSLFEDKDGRIWVGSANGVSVLDNQKWNCWCKIGEVWLENVMDIKQDAKGNIWLATNNGVIKWDGERVKHYFSNLPVNEVLVDENDNIWIGRMSFIDMYENGNWISYYVGKHNDLERQVNTLCKDKWGVLWIGTDHGILKLKEGQWLDPMYKEDGLPGNNVTCIRASAHQDSICVGTTRGASFYDLEQWTLMTKTNGLPSVNITNICVNGNDLWLGSDQGASYYKYWFRKYFSSNNSMLPNDSVNDVYVVDSTVWMATNNGVGRYDCSSLGDFWSVYKEDTAYYNFSKNISDVPENFVPSYYWREKRRIRLISNHVLSVDGNDDYTWFGTDEGASRFDGVNWKSYDYDPNGGLYHCPVREIMNFNDDFYFGSRCGLTLRTSNRWEYVINSTVKNYHFTSINEFGDYFLDKKNNLWISGTAIFRLIDPTFPADFLYSISANKRRITEYVELPASRMYRNINQQYGFRTKFGT